MNRILTCVGKTAEKPYYFEKVYANLYSLEELCYVIYENAFLIDKDIVNKELADWVNTECGLPDLARDLYSYVNQNVLPASFAGRILEYTGYYTKDEIEQVETVLKLNVSLNVFEKWKAKADFLYESHHYLLAIKEYEHVLESLDEDETDLRSKVYNNMGVTYMALYLYESAAECFEKSYSINNNGTAWKHYFIAKRLSLSEDDYVRLIAESEEAYRVSVPIEGELLAVNEAFEKCDETVKMKELFALQDGKEASLYYEEIDRLTGILKSDYREIALEADELSSGVEQ